MSMTVRYFGSQKPGPGVNPVRVEVDPKTPQPFGKKTPVDWMTGKHLPLDRNKDYRLMANAAERKPEYLDAKVKRSIEVDSEAFPPQAHLVGDEDAPGNNKAYGTDGTGERGWRPGLPDGANTGDLLYWDHSTEEWKVLSVSGLSSGDVLKWNGSGWVKVTPVEVTVLSDIIYDNTSHQLQKSYRTAKVLEAGTETEDEMISGGQFVAET